MRRGSLWVGAGMTQVRVPAGTSQLRDAGWAETQLQQLMGFYSGNTAGPLVFLRQVPKRRPVPRVSRPSELSGSSCQAPTLHLARSPPLALACEGEPAPLPFWGGSVTSQEEEPRGRAVVPGTGRRLCAPLKRSPLPQCPAGLEDPGIAGVELSFLSPALLSPPS